MTLTVGQRIEAQGSGLVGRESERAFLHSVLGEEGPFVVFIHGIGGVGKSTLVEAFTAEARARGAVVLRLDSGSIEPTPRGFLAAISNATGGDLTTADDAAPPPREPRRSGRAGPRSLRGPPADRPVAAADLRPRARRGHPGRPRRPRGAAAGLVDRHGTPLPEPAAGKPAARRRRDAPPAGGRRRRRPRADQPPRARPPAVAAPRRGGARRRPGARPRGDDRHGDRRGADGALPRPTRSADAPGARRGLRRPPADALADRRDAARRRAAGRVRAAAGPAVRRAQQRRARPPRHRPRGRGRLPPGVRSRPVAPLPDRRVAPAPRRGHPRDVARDVALHRGPAVHPRESGRARGLLPDVRAPLLRRAGPARRLAGDPGDRRRVRAARVGCDLRGLVAPPARRVLGGPRRRRASRRVRRCDPDRPRSRGRCSTPIRSPGSGATTSGGRPCRAVSGSSCIRGYMVATRTIRTARSWSRR